jgi:hypothetical protein
MQSAANSVIETNLNNMNEPLTTITDIKRWIGGERVTRRVFLDDGTWNAEGDKCLAASPLKHGTVLKRDHSGVWVRWDDNSVSVYLNHGIEPELVPNPTARAFHGTASMRNLSRGTRNPRLADIPDTITDTQMLDWLLNHCLAKCLGNPVAHYPERKDIDAAMRREK